MKIIVPLAGPDFELPSDKVKAEVLVLGKPLLLQAIEGRTWCQCGTVSDRDFVFVLRDTPRSRTFAETKLSSWYPSARSVYLSNIARGAALSALAGMAAVADCDEPICIDLVDILYNSRVDPVSLFDSSDVGAAALCFSSTSPEYSYLRLREDGSVIEAAEKRVISSNASVGTYFFSSSSVYLAALSRNLRNRDLVTYNSMFFVCPVLNGVIESGLRVLAPRVENVIDIKSINP